MAAVAVARLLPPPEVVVGFLVDLGSVAATYEVMETLSPAERSRQLASFVDNIRLVTLRAVTALRDAGVTPMCRFDFFDSSSTPPLSPHELQQHFDASTASRVASLGTPARLTPSTFSAFTQELAHLARELATLPPVAGADRQHSSALLAGTNTTDSRSEDTMHMVSSGALGLRDRPSHLSSFQRSLRRYRSHHHASHGDGSGGATEEANERGVSPLSRLSLLCQSVTEVLGTEWKEIDAGLAGVAGTRARRGAMMRLFQRPGAPEKPSAPCDGVDAAVDEAPEPPSPGAGGGASDVHAGPSSPAPSPTQLRSGHQLTSIQFVLTTCPRTAPQLARFLGRPVSTDSGTCAADAAAFVRAQLHEVLARHAAAPIVIETSSLNPVHASCADARARHRARYNSHRSGAPQGVEAHALDADDAAGVQCSGTCSVGCSSPSCAFGLRSFNAALRAVGGTIVPGEALLGDVLAWPALWVLRSFLSGCLSAGDGTTPPSASGRRGSLWGGKMCLAGRRGGAPVLHSLCDVVIQGGRTHDGGALVIRYYMPRSQASVAWFRPGYAHALTSTTNSPDMLAALLVHLAGNKLVAVVDVFGWRDDDCASTAILLPVSECSATLAFIDEWHLHQDMPASAADVASLVAPGEPALSAVPSTASANAAASASASSPAHEGRQSDLRPRTRLGSSDVIPTALGYAFEAPPRASGAEGSGRVLWDTATTPVKRTTGYTHMSMSSAGVSAGTMEAPWSPLPVAGTHAEGQAGPGLGCLRPCDVLATQPTSTMPRRLAALQNDVAAVSVATMDKLAKRLRSRALSHRAGKRKGRPSAAPSSLASVLSVDVRSLAIDAASAATPPGSSGGGGATSTNMVPSASQLSPQRAGPSDGLTVTQFEATPSKVAALMRSVMASPPRPQQPAQVVPVENPTTPPRPGSTAGASATDAHVLAHLPLPVRRVLDQLQDAYDRCLSDPSAAITSFATQAIRTAVDSLARLSTVALVPTPARRHTRARERRGFTASDDEGKPGTSEADAAAVRRVRAACASAASGVSPWFCTPLAGDRHDGDGGVVAGVVGQGTDPESLGVPSACVLVQRALRGLLEGSTTRAAFQGGQAKGTKVTRDRRIRGNQLKVIMRLQLQAWLPDKERERRKRRHREKWLHPVQALLEQVSFTLTSQDQFQSFLGDCLVALFAARLPKTLLTIYNELDLGSSLPPKLLDYRNERKNRRKRQEGDGESGAGGGRGAPDTTNNGASETAGHHASVRTAQATLPSRRPTASLDVTGLGNSVVSRLISRQKKVKLYARKPRSSRPKRDHTERSKRKQSTTARATSSTNLRRHTTTRKRARTSAAGDAPLRAKRTSSLRTATQHVSARSRSTRGPPKRQRTSAQAATATTTSRPPVPVLGMDTPFKNPAAAASAGMPASIMVGSTPLRASPFKARAPQARGVVAETPLKALVQETPLKSAQRRGPTPAHSSGASSRPRRAQFRRALRYDAGT